MGVLSCPICLVASGDDAAELSAPAFATTPCGHTFCVDCIERVLLKPREEGIPARAPCPMCRTTVNLFELACPAKETLVYETERDMSSWPIANHIYQQRPLFQRHNAAEILQREIDRKGCLDGFGITFCFREPAASMQVARPLGVVPASARASPLPWALREPRTTMDSITFHRTDFHQPSMVFCGKADFANPMRGSDGYFYDKLDCVLQFSSHGHYVRKANLSWRYASKDSNLPAEARLPYPLDGAWEVQCSGRESRRIQVQHHSFSCFGAHHDITLDQDRCPRFTWPSHLLSQPVVQSSQQKILPGTHGPGIGETLEWEYSIDGKRPSRIIWKRLETELENCWKSVPILPGSFVYRRCLQPSDDESCSRPLHQANTLWGNTFCQFYAVGLASYHFLEPESEDNYRAYISYESPRTEAWPPLDNGKRVPARVPFRNLTWDPAALTFTGDILWEEDCGTTWMNESRWSYEIVLDPSFLFVQSGTCRRPGREPHQFGSDLIYINAALETSLRSTLQGRSPGAYLDVIRQWRDNNASSETLGMLGEVAMAVMDNRESMFDFNI